MERKTGFEPATTTLARWSSTGLSYFRSKLQWRKHLASRARQRQGGAPQPARPGPGRARTRRGLPARGPGTPITPRHGRPGPEVRRHLGRAPRAHPRGGRPRGRRRAPPGNDMVVVVSAMGQTTDELLRLARQISRAPEPARAGHAAHHRRAHLDGAARHGARRPRRARPSPSPARRAASSPTRGHGARAHRRRPPGSACARSSTAGTVVIVAGFQGVNAGRRRSPRWAAAAPTPPRWRWPPRSARRRARSTPTSPASSPPTRAWCRRRGACPTPRLPRVARRSPTWARGSCTRAAWTWRRAYRVPLWVKIEFRRRGGHAGGRQATPRWKARTSPASRTAATSRWSRCGRRHADRRRRRRARRCSSAPACRPTCWRIESNRVERCRVSWIAPDADAERLNELWESLDPPPGRWTLNVHRGLALVSIVGHALADRSDLRARCRASPRRAEVAVRAVRVDSLSVSFVVPRNAVESALRALHAAYFEPVA